MKNIVVIIFFSLIMNILFLQSMNSNKKLECIKFCNKTHPTTRRTASSRFHSELVKECIQTCINEKNEKIITKINSNNKGNS